MVGGGGSLAGLTENKTKPAGAELGKYVLYSIVLLIQQSSNHLSK